LIFSARLGSWSWGQGLVRAQLAMAIGLLPLLLALGLPVSASGPLANLLAVPVIGLLVVPLALLGTLLLPVPWIGSALLWLAGAVLDLLFAWLTQLSLWWPAWLPSALPLWAWSMVLLGALLLLLPAGVPVRSLGLFLLLPLWFTPSERPPVGQAEVWMLDVGQGSALLIRTHRHALLYDAGPRFGEFDTGERVVLPSLRALGVDQLDMMLLSHADNDHAGGALAIQRGMPLAQVVGGELQRLPRKLQAEPCGERRWEWDGVQFSTWQWTAARDGNQASCVLRIEARGEALLLTGDIDHQAERHLLNSALSAPVHWLLAPHHGSRTSSSMALLQQLSPHTGLISRGRHNAFGHPDKQVVARYQAISAQLYDTAEHGAVRIRLGAFEQAQALRDRARFWREK